MASVSWRWIPPIATSGLTQMAIDDWMIDQVRSGHPPILRFYTWSEPTISLGFHQKQRPTMPDSIPLVRRPTGGRAVLHGSSGELTYAIALGTARATPVQTALAQTATIQTTTTQTTTEQAATEQATAQTANTISKPTIRNPIRNSIRNPIRKRTNRADIYRDICRFLIHGWSQLGVTLHFGGDRDYTQRTSCFSTATPADLVTDEGIKLIGSAQLYRGDTVLQHGSMQLAPDYGLFTQIFGEPCPRAVLPTLAGDDIISTLTEAARSSFGVTFEIRELDAREWKEIEARRDQFRVLASP